MKLLVGFWYNLIKHHVEYPLIVANTFIQHAVSPLTPSPVLDTHQPLEHPTPNFNNLLAILHALTSADLANCHSNTTFPAEWKASCLTPPDHRPTISAKGSLSATNTHHQHQRRSPAQCRERPFPFRAHGKITPDDFIGAAPTRHSTRQAILRKISCLTYHYPGNPTLCSPLPRARRTPFTGQSLVFIISSEANQPLIPDAACIGLLVCCSLLASVTE